MSSMPLLLDTHVWVRYINAAPPIKPSAIASIDRARQSGSAFVSVISIWETALLVKKGRLDLPITIDRWVERALEIPGIQLLPFTPEIAIASVQLPDALNKDPSDRILVASARIEGLILMTRDKAILRFARKTSLPYEIA